MNGSSRTWLPVLAAMPAVLALLSGAGMGLYMRAVRSPVPRWYSPAAEQAEGRGDFKTAAVCYGRMLQGHPGDSRIGFELARCLRESGQLDEVPAATQPGE